jgi:hypothetical protein
MSCREDALKYKEGENSVRFFPRWEFKADEKYIASVNKKTAKKAESKKDLPQNDNQQWNSTTESN